jgi:DNA repair exonuclease SbcCD nuclease subunit
LAKAREEQVGYVCFRLEMVPVQDIMRGTFDYRCSAAKTNRSKIVIIAHLSDLHLGRKSQGDPQGAERLNSLRQAITRLTAESPDVILIAGDSFESPKVEKAVVHEAARTLDRANNGDGVRIPVVVIPGNHDPSDSDSLWNGFASALAGDSCVRLVRQAEVIELADRRLIVEAYPCPTRYSPESPWTPRLSSPIKSESAIHVLLAHGTLQGGPVPEGESDAYPFTEQDLKSLGADYVALGHFHGIYPPWDGEEVERTYAYSGTHEPDEFGRDSGYAILAVVEKGRPTRLQRIKTGQRRWSLLEIQAPADLKALEALCGEVQADVYPSRHVIRVKLGPNIRLSGGEAEKLEDTEHRLRALGAHVDRREELQLQVDVRSLDLATLPSGAAKEALLTLQQDLEEASNEDDREGLTAALQIGWEKLQPKR